jgi:hypothetical protein
MLVAIECPIRRVARRAGVDQVRRVAADGIATACSMAPAGNSRSGLRRNSPVMLAGVDDGLV